MSSFFLGLLLILLGIALMAITYLVARYAPRLRKTKLPVPDTPILIPELATPNQAVFIVQTGGRIIHANQLAREWFGFLEEQPNLERLAKKANPSDLFLGLCFTEGQARFTINSRLVEGVSYFVPEISLNSNGHREQTQSATAMLVALRHPQVTAIRGDDGRTTSQALDIFAELSQRMASNLEINATLEAILESVERLIPCDHLEITTWDEESHSLIPYRFVGAAGINRRLEKSNQTYSSQDDGYAAYFVARKAPLLIDDVEGFREVQSTRDKKIFPYQSYLGLPLLVAGELIGTLELAAQSLSAFDEEDLSALQILAGPASVALNNSMRFMQEQQRVFELSGLTSLAQAAKDLHNFHELIGELVEGIASLIPVKVLGFWLFRENRRVLEAQPPFRGIPEQMLGFFQVEILEGSSADSIWKNQTTIRTSDAANDAVMKALGLDSMAVAAGFQETILMPLRTPNRMMGYLQIADRLDGKSFGPEDIRLLAIIVSQSAAIVENAFLVRESQDRAQRSEVLRRIASIAGSPATLEEIFSFSIRDLAQLLRADIGLIFMLDENLGELYLDTNTIFGAVENIKSTIPRLPMVDHRFQETATGRRQSYILADVNTPGDFPQYYISMFERLQVRSGIIAPFNVGGHSVGEIILASTTLSHFDHNDLTLVSTTASQLATAVEKNKLFDQTDEGLRRKVGQLMALNRISRELSITLDLNYLLQAVYDQVLQATNADCGAILLFDPKADVSNPKTTFHVGDTSSHGLTPIELRVLRAGEAFIVNDYLKPNPDSPDTMPVPPHPGVRSSLIVPIAFQAYVAGLIHLHALAPDRFDSTSLEIAQSLAVQAAIAVGNAQRNQEQRTRSELLNRRVETLTALLETTRFLQTGQPLEESLETIAYGVQSATPFNVILISVYDPDSHCLRRTAGAGIPLDTMAELKSKTQDWEAVLQLLDKKYQFSQSYFIPRNFTKDYPANLHMVQVMENADVDLDAVENKWHPEDLLLVPLWSSDNQPLGLISVDDPRNGLRPDQPSIESLEIFANQATLVIETYQKVKTLGKDVESLSSELDAVRSAYDSVMAKLPVIQQENLTQGQTLLRLNQHAQRLKAGLMIADQVDRLQDWDEILLVLGQQILTQMGMSLVLVGDITDGRPRLLHVIGNLPAGVTPQALLGQRNPLRSVLQTGEALFVADLETRDEWKASPLLINLNARAFVCQPIMAGLPGNPNLAAGAVEAAVLAVSDHPLPDFTQDDEEIFSLVARQVTISLQNLRLLKETNKRLEEMNVLLEFNRQLGTFEMGSILNTLLKSVMRVIPAANAGMVALWDTVENSLVPQAALGYPNNDQLLQIYYAKGEALPGKAFALGQVIRPDEVVFAQDYNLPPEKLIQYREAAQGKLPVSCLVVPLQTFDATIGVVVLDNFSLPAAFSDEDQALVLALARQTALTLENVRLYEAAEQRTAQLQALTQVAGTITSSLQSTELVRTLLDQVKLVVPFDTGILWLRTGDQMTVQAADGFADSEERVGLSVALEDSSLLREMATTNRPISVGDVNQDERFPALMEHLYLSWLGVPLMSKGEVVGVIVLEKSEAHFYTPEHIQSMVTFAGQVAVALENARLYEDSVQRAAELDERSQRLAALNRLSSALSSTLDLNSILVTLAQELTQVVNTSLVSVILFDDDQRPVVHLEYPQQTTNLPILLPESDVFVRLHESLGIFSTEMVSDEPELTGLMDYLNQTHTQSLLMVPLISGNNLLGVAILHNNQVYRYSPDEVELALTVSNQVAVAIQNAQLFAQTEQLIAETQQRSVELSTLYDLGVRFTQVLDQNRLLEITFENVSRLIQPDAVVVALVTSEESMVAHILDHGQRLESLIVQRRGSSFSEFVIRTSQPLLIEDTSTDNKPVQGMAAGDPCRCWLGVPLIVRGVTIGVISVQSDQANVFGDPQLHLLSQIANQLSVALDNARLFATVQSYTEELEQRVNERTEQVNREHRRIQTLLSITTELSASLDLDLVLGRTLGVVNETLESEQSSILLIQPDSNNLFLRSSLGYTSHIPQTGQESQLKKNEGLAGWVIMNRQAVLVDDLHDDPRWEQRKDRTNLHRSAMVVPLMVGEEILGVMMVYHRTPCMFNSDQLDLVQAVAKQIAIAINNTQLYGLIRDQAERLGDMLRTQHVETSRSQAILEAVADGVLVTDARRKITLLNASAEKILNLSRFDILGQSLEQFTGLFGQAAQSWVQTIRTWSDDTTTYQVGDTYEAQVELDNRKIVSVHLSPVHLRNDFLGTVSIFRDITHQVEVDRLKSEFVATVSHELRTPMTSIKGYVEILLMGAAGQLNTQQTHFLEVVKGNTERLAVLVNDLLDVSRIEAGKVTLSLGPVDLRAVADEIVETFIRRMKDENRLMVFEKDFPPDLPLIHGDSDRVRQILDNLIENAYQYTQVGGTIKIKMEQIGTDVQVYVQDNGIGIRPEEHHRVFERFYRGEDPLVLATSGTGLGLPIVQTLVHMHNGRIWFESEGIPGLGSTFFFTLPVYNPNSPVETDNARGLIFNRDEDDKSGVLETARLETAAQPQMAEDETDDSDLIIGTENLEDISTEKPSEKDDEDWLMN